MVNMSALFYLDVLRERYEESKNPLIFWEAFQVCLDEKLHIPDWVSNYFKESASKLLELSERKETSENFL
jgi:hypothetical protein